MSDTEYNYENSKFTQIKKTKHHEVWQKKGCYGLIRTGTIYIIRKKGSSIEIFSSKNMQEIDEKILELEK